LWNKFGVSGVDLPQPESFESAGLLQPNGFRRANTTITNQLETYDALEWSLASDIDSVPADVAISTASEFFPNPGAQALFVSSIFKMTIGLRRRPRVPVQTLAH
jgi:hypothetical protein